MRHLDLGEIPDLPEKKPGPPKEPEVPLEGAVICAECKHHHSIGGGRGGGLAMHVCKHLSRTTVDPVTGVKGYDECKEYNADGKCEKFETPPPMPSVEGPPEIFGGDEPWVNDGEGWRRERKESRWRRFWRGFFSWGDR